MTGFSSKIITIPLKDESKINIAVNLKSLNSRFFEATCKLHYQLTNFETEFIKILKHALFRGHIYLTIHMSSQNLFKGSVEPSLKIIEGYIHAIQQVKQKFNLEGSLSVEDLFHLPNVFTVEEREIDETTKELLFNTLKMLITELIATQEKEGAALKKDIERRIEVMHKEIEIIEQSSATLLETQKKKAQATLHAVEADPTTLAELQKNAAMMLLDKMDIHEEIIRFKSHLKNLQSILTSAEIEKGKRLDFTLQEMAREINTIAAKCSDAAISAQAINIKVEVEKAREQAQNIV